MGTRHVIAIVQNNEYKLAKYGQFDGYPSGQGVKILKFLRDSNLDRFAEKVAKCSFLNDKEISAVNAKAEKSNRMPEHLSRDTGAKILQMIMDSDGLKTHNSISFVAESLFCEWAYVVDLDKQTFEVYRGFQETPVPEDQRFASMNPDPDKFVPEYEGESLYYPVHLVKTYSMYNVHPLFLPSNEEFLTECEPQDEDEE